MKYCLRCLYPANHPLGITFDDDGVCSGCRVHEEKDIIDWSERRAALEALVARYRSPDDTAYDCIVPVTGARDSYFIVHFLKHELGLNPLLVTYNRHHNTGLGIENLSYLRTLLDCDILTLTLKPSLVKALMRKTLRLRGSMYWHVLAGHTVFPVRIAVAYKVPLIVWGAHQGVESVGMFSHLDSVEMSRRYRCEHDLMGLEAERLIELAPGLPHEEMSPLLYPRDEEIAAVGVRGIYLSNYVRWDTRTQHEQMVSRYSYALAEHARTFDCYSDVDCLHYTGIHDYLRYLKWGFGKVLEHASREIRLGRISREEGIDLVAEHGDRTPENLAEFLEYAELTENDILAAVEPFRDPRIWEAKGKGWQLRDSVLNHRSDIGVDAVRLTKRPAERLRPNRSLDGSSKLLATGFVDDCARPGEPNVERPARFL